MPLITLEKAAKQIQQACQRSQGKSPFFFLVGAGISSPPIPLASEIVEQCKAIAKQNHNMDEPARTLPIDVYSHWFQEAYEQPDHRRQFLRELINGKHISHANFRLAHVLLNKSVANMVVTTNFDDFLSRALLLFGKQHIVCDHPNMVHRINPEERDDIQIIHVHGTYWFYDCCNLSDEIASRAQSHAQTDSTMAGLLGSILRLRVPLVIGYSGWEGDVVMTALKRRLQDQLLPYNLYWFCYRQASVELLPDWLKNHSNVKFVIPHQTSHEPFPELAAEESVAQSPRELLSHAGAMGISDKDSIEHVLPAHKVLDELIQTFQLKAPELTSDPLKFFANHLRASLPQDDSGRAAADSYFIRSVIERIERAQLWEQKQTKALQLVERQLEKVRDALRRSQYQEAIQQGSEIRKSGLEVAQLKELLGAMSVSASSLNDNSQEEIDGYKMVIEMGDMLASQGDLSSDLEVAKALINMGAALFTLDQKQEAIRTYDKVLKRFRDRTEPALREQVARAFVNKGVTLGRLNRNVDALAAYNEVLDRFGDSTDPSLFHEIAGALINKGVTLRTLKQWEEAIKAYDEVLKRFRDRAEPTLREEVARALINKGVTFSRLKDREEAINAYDEVVNLFSDAPEPSLQKQVARALVNLGVTYSMFNKRQEAIACYEEVSKRFKDASEPALQEQVANALNGIGFQMLCEAKQVWEKDEAAARNMLSKAREMISEALVKMAEEPIFLGNLGYIKFLLDDRDEARELLTQAISLGGERIRQIEINDSRINPQVPPDTEFREMVRSIPAYQGEDLGLIRSLTTSYSRPSKKRASQAS